MEWLCWMLNASVSRMATWLWTVVWHHRPMLILGVKIWILQKSDNVYNCSSFIVGKEFSRGGAHGKTVCMVQTAQSLRVAISLTTCNSRTKLGATTTSLPFYSTRQPVVMVASGFLADQGSRFHLTPCRWFHHIARWLVQTQSHCMFIFWCTISDCILLLTLVHE